MIFLSLKLCFNSDCLNFQGKYNYTYIATGRIQQPSVVVKYESS